MPKTEPALIDRAEVADRLATSPNHVSLLTRRGELPHVRIGNRYRFRPQDVDAYIASHLHVAGS